MNKLSQLLDWFYDKTSVLVSLSGGVDSALVAYAAFQKLGKRSFAVTADYKTLSEEELAFYDALETKDSEVKVLGDEILTNIAREITEKIRESKTIDWPLRESGRAKIMSAVKRVLKIQRWLVD